MKILIVDDEIEITEMIEFLVQDAFTCGVTTLVATSGNSAIEILSNNLDIDICICDHNMPNGMGTDVIKHLISTKSNTKFVLCSTVLPSEKPREYPAEAVFTNIQKPEITEGVDELYKIVMKAGTIIRQKGEVDEFIPISVQILALMGKVPADIYIRMSENKYVKCTNQLDEFTASDEKKYLEKSIDKLYFKKDEQKIDLNATVGDAVAKIMKRRGLSLSDKMCIAHSQLVELIKFTGITPELAEVSKKNIRESIAMIAMSPVVSDSWGGMNLLGEYPSRLYTLNALLSSIIVKKLSWSSESTMYKLTLASFLQDISLDSIALMEICDYKEFLEKESTFTKIEIKRYLDHPQRSTELLKAFKDAPADVEKLLLEQHEMPDGEGFPRKLNSNQLGPLTCTFILSGIFARHILREGTSFDFDKFINYLNEKGYSRGNFKEPFVVIKSMKKS